MQTSLKLLQLQTFGKLIVLMNFYALQIFGACGLRNKDKRVIAISISNIFQSIKVREIFANMLSIYFLVSYHIVKFQTCCTVDR